MKTCIIQVLMTALLATLIYQPATLRAQGTAFTYQGRLNNGATPASGTYDLAFSLYTTNIAGAPMAGPVTNTAVAVTNGLFTTLVNLGNAFTGTSNWLEIAVSTNGANSFSTLAPRQQVTPTPYALYAVTASNVTGAIPAAQLPPSPAFPGTVTATAFAGNGANVTNVNAASLGGLNAINFWQLGGNAVSTGQFLGSVNNQPVEIWVNGQRALRLEPSIFGQPNLIGNSATNTISANNDYSGIFEGSGNQIQSYSSGSTIGGGTFNLIQGNSSFYPASDLGSVIAGGDDNVIQSNGYNATISGGLGNVIQAGSPGTTIGGGNNNLILTNVTSGTIGGGFNNRVSGNYGTVPGGNANRAGGVNSFAAGTDAYATNNGSFVLADDQLIPFGSTLNNQFSARFTGGVVFVTGGAGMKLDGQPILAGSNGTGLTNVNASALNGFSSARFWKTNGNTGANPANGAYLGTADNLPLELRVNNQRALRIEPDATSPNVIGGYSGNTVKSGFSGAFIGGGGAAGGDSNSVSGDFASVVGGAGNHATASYATAMGENTTASGLSSTATGDTSTASGNYSLAGGVACLASGENAVALGAATQASGQEAIAMGDDTIAGGLDSIAIGDFCVANGDYSVALGSHTSASGTYSVALGNHAQAANSGSFVWADGSSGTALISANTNTVTFRASGGYRLFSNSGATAGVSLAANGAAWASISDQNAKKNFAPVNGRTVLDKLAAVPVEQWNYKWEKDNDVPNIGPMAQAFKAAFYPGRDDKSITTLEFDGVELAAIQGLNQKVEAQQAENLQLKQQNELLLQRLNQLEALVKALDEKR